jgi:hypothetical protein
VGNSGESNNSSYSKNGNAVVRAGYSCVDFRPRNSSAVRRSSLFRYLACAVLACVLLSVLYTSSFATDYGVANYSDKGNYGGSGMSFLSRVADNYAKGMGATNALNSRMSYSGGYGLTDYSEPINAQNAYMAVSSVFGCFTAYATNAPQVTKKVVHLDGSPWEDHPVQWLIQHPNEDHSERIMELYNCIYKPLGGATRLFLGRNLDWPGKPVVSMRPYSTYEIAPEPVKSAKIGRNSWIDYYWHRPIGGTPERVERENVISLRFPSIHPITPQMDLSPIAGLVLDIAQDKAVTKLPTDLMQKSAFLSAVYSMGAKSTEMPDEVFEQVRADFQSGSTGDNRFNPRIIRGDGKIDILMPDFRRMDWAKLGERPELRICAALRVPVRYMGFSAGIDASTSDNYVASWYSFFADAIMGQALMDCDALTHALTRENWANHPSVAFGCDRRATSQFRIIPDSSEAQVLKIQKAQSDLAAAKIYLSGLRTKDESRQTIGEKPVTDGTGGEYGKGSTDASQVPGDNSNVLAIPEKNKT